ncbi:MAG: hypothetical protein CVU43_12535 [Chloroflexi bacterium HGW-Chloroflexi-5]|jgi:hypothetical protein|nr:MAG: hypothetical protein CVU43_12535 [Chloroflexi bacterium HGW-Chloroflexi-5]PKP09835.1 MAG: hypothetical protein CVU09_09405 [Bacteroidetes bacterium HGW-Bacteroidetes-4]
MHTNKKYFNTEAKALGDQLSADDRKLLITKFDVSESYISHLLNGNRIAMRGKGAEILEFAKKLASINNQKLELA